MSRTLPGQNAHIEDAPTRSVYARAAMAIKFVEIKAAPTAKALNSEWVVLENDGEAPFQARGSSMTVGRRGSGKNVVLGTLDPGFVLGPGERIRLCTGTPGTRAHGAPPQDDVKNYHLFLPKAYLGGGAGALLSLTLRGQVVCKAEFDPAQPNGIAAAK
jgi:hypothetical protein